MTTKIGINGFGRIGRKVARLALERDDVEIVAINSLEKPEIEAHLFKYDSVHGTLPYTVKVEGSTMLIETKKGLKKIQMFAEKDPAAVKWSSAGATLIHECTGKFTEKEGASLHLKGGAKRVIISAPSKDADATICMGVNDKVYDPSKHVVISNASCTTNCLAPLAKVIDDAFGIKRGLMTTIHAYTNDQRILDLGHKDLRRARAAAMSIIPTTTGAAKAVGLVLPHLKGKLDGYSFRVPTPNVSMVDFTVELNKTATKESINEALKSAATGAMKGILAVESAPLVSVDFNGCLNSSTVDVDLTMVMEGNMAKIVSWYDNESGFSARMLDLSVLMAAKGL
jgi:glyceraldehyde 3-phosphate dehydrogenase